jgi:DNA repair protein RadC
MLFCLDGNHSIAAYNVVSVGTATSTVVHPREVFQPAILAGAVSIIVAHNHPSGSIEPSQEDFKATDQLKQASKLLGIKLLDHIIVGEKDSYYSFQEHGKMI